MEWFGWLRRTSHKSTGGSGTAAAATRSVGGREYALGVPYMLPSDAEEVNRLDFQHFMLRQALQGNYAAPIAHPHSILDVGTGTGRWAREMAQLFPQANVVGLDVKLPATDDQADEGISPDLRPANYTFVAANLLEGLPFADASFDFVHQRLLYAALPADRWPQAVQELARVTVPGGWVELVEFSSWFEDAGPAAHQLSEWTMVVSRQHGIELTLSDDLPPLLTAARLINIEQRVIKIPVGEWGGRLGKMCEADFVAINAAVKPLMVRSGIVTEAQWDETTAAWRVETSTLHSSLVAYVVYGQRPR